MRLMPGKPFIVAGLGLVAAIGLSFTGCKKAPAPGPDPHSAEAVMVTLVGQVKLLNDAAARSDFKYVHDFNFYLHGLLEALNSKLNATQKQDWAATFAELHGVIDQLDASSGRKHTEATQNSMNRLSAIVAQMEKRFQEMKQADPALSRRAETASTRRSHVAIIYAFVILNT